MNIVIQKKNKYLNQLNEAINKGNDIFLFTSADWCGHCKVMKPEWFKLKQNNYGLNVVIANINSEIYKSIHNFGPDVNGFPDLRYINKQKGIVENFENNDRTYEAFDKWIRSKISATATNANQHIKGMVYEQKNNTRKNRKNNRKQHSRQSNRQNRQNRQNRRNKSQRRK